jgi:hypothetical protein
MTQKASATDAYDGGMTMRTGEQAAALAMGRYQVTCRDADGNTKWEEEYTNLVTNEGLDELLNTTLKALTPQASWFVGLKAAGAAAGTDTMASHAGWAELTIYSNANRPTWTGGTVSAQSVSNTASKAVFNINAGGTVAGSFLTSNNTKGGTTGKLYSAGDFTGGSRAVISGDTLEVTATFTTARP